MRVELREGSLAGVVLGVRHTATPTKLGRAAQRRLPADSPSGIVLGVSAARPSLLLLASLLAAGALHAGLGFAAVGSQNDVQTAVLAARGPIQLDHLVELEPPPPQPPPPPEEAPPPKPVPQVKEPARTAEPTEPAENTPPAPAEAGEVLAVDDASHAADFTGFDMTTGKGARYAGGVTASSGTSTRAVRSPAARAGSKGGVGTGAPSKARPVGLPQREWKCPWPAEAAVLALDEQFVVLRVVVQADGSVASAKLVSDPGHGFGRVALACARSQHFPPATDVTGQPVSATSPPIRVRFTKP